MDDKYLNILYNAALKSGRPLIELANERLPNLNQPDCEELCILVKRAKAGIYKYIEEHFEIEEGLTIPEKEVKLWMKQNYPWMSKRNISNGISKGLFFAWHG